MNSLSSGVRYASESKRKHSLFPFINPLMHPIKSYAIYGINTISLAVIMSILECTSNKLSISAAFLQSRALVSTVVLFFKF